MDKYNNNEAPDSSLDFQFFDLVKKCRSSFIKMTHMRIYFDEQEIVISDETFKAINGFHPN